MWNRWMPHEGKYAWSNSVMNSSLVMLWRRSMFRDVITPSKARKNVLVRQIFFYLLQGNNYTKPFHGFFNYSRNRTKFRMLSLITSETVDPGIKVFNLKSVLHHAWLLFLTLKLLLSGDELACIYIFHITFTYQIHMLTNELNRTSGAGETCAW